MNIELYTLDLIALLKEKALRARAELQSSADEDKAYLRGRLMAFHETISLMQQQAKAFDIPLEKLDLADVDPERDLL